MAHITGEPSLIDEKSNEMEMLKALEKLPDDYYVIHSLKTVTLNGDMLDEAESDFVIFNPKYGILFVEAKAGKVTRNQDGHWFYQNKEPLKHDPFDQAASGMYRFKNKLMNNYPSLRSSIRKCKFMFAVWFPSYSKAEIDKFDLPSNVAKEIILTKDTLNDPLPDIERIMERLQKVHIFYEKVSYYDGKEGYKHELSINDSMTLFKKGICPHFGIISETFDLDFQEKIYIRLLKEQMNVLDFLRDQRTAAINGAAGTGKTLIAFERAERIANETSKVLFLCYNRHLKEYLKRKAEEKQLRYVDFYTIDGLSCYLSQSNKPNYVKANAVLEGKIKSKDFDYKHIIIDEAQDFGKEEVMESKIADKLLEYVEGDESRSMFVFYDKNQMIQSERLPYFIDNVDSKLTLYKNCRNTQPIAATSMNFLNKTENTYDLKPKGDKPMIFFYDSDTQLKGLLNSLIIDLHQKNTIRANRVILSAKSYDKDAINKSDIIGFLNENNEYVINNTIKTKCYTCKTFKGLEEDNVIIIDIDEDILLNDPMKLYVGSSRAKSQLYMFLKMNKKNISSVLSKIKFNGKLPSPEATLANYLKSKYKK